jgi:hypothetical protein
MSDQTKMTTIYALVDWSTVSYVGSFAYVWAGSCRGQSTENLKLSHNLKKQINPKSSTYEKEVTGNVPKRTRDVFELLHQSVPLSFFGYGHIVGSCLDSY